MVKSELMWWEIFGFEPDKKYARPQVIDSDTYCESKFKTSEVFYVQVNL